MCGSVFQNARLEPFLDQVEDARVGDPMLQESGQPGLADFIEKASDLNFQYPVHLRAAGSDHQGVQRIVLAALGAEPIRKAEEVLLVNRIQHRGSRPLDDFVFEGSNRDWALSAVRFWYVQSTARLCPIRSDTLLYGPDRAGLRCCD